MRADFDADLVLVDSNGFTLVSNDVYEGDYLHSRIEGYRLPYSGSYAIIARGYSGETGDYTLSVEGINIAVGEEEVEIPEATRFVVYFADDLNSASVWSISDNRQIRTLRDVDNVEFIQENLFVVEYFSELPELFYNDVSKAAEFIDLVESPDPDTTYIVALYDDAPGEIILRTNGEKVALTDEVTEATFYGEERIYLVVWYSDDHIEVWDMDDDSPHLLVNLGDGIENYYFDTHNQRFIVFYNDGSVYLVDLVMVEALSSVMNEDSSADDLLKEVCTYLFPPGTIDEDLLVDFLEGNEPQACQ